MSTADQSAYRGEIIDGRELPFQIQGVHAMLPQRGGISYGADVRGSSAAPVRQKGELVKLKTPRTSSSTSSRNSGRRGRRSCEGIDCRYYRDDFVLSTADMDFEVGERPRHRGVAAEPEDLPRDLVLPANTMAFQGAGARTSSSVRKERARVEHVCQTLNGSGLAVRPARSSPSWKNYPGPPRRRTDQ